MPVAPSTPTGIFVIVFSWSNDSKYCEVPQSGDEAKRKNLPRGGDIRIF